MSRIQLIWLLTLQAALAMCLFMQTQLQLGSYIQVSTNGTHSPANLYTRLKPLLWLVCVAYNYTCKSRDEILQICWRMCFICAYINVTTQLELCLHEQTHLVANAACRVSSQLLLIYSQLLTFYCKFPVPFQFLFISILFTFCCTTKSDISAMRLETQFL